MQSAWAIGYAAAAIVAGFVVPRFGWRAAFFVGVLPALVTLWMRRALQESEIWMNSRRKKAESSISLIFSRSFARPTILLTLLSLATIFAYWGFNLWIPAYLSLPVTRGGRRVRVFWLYQRRLRPEKELLLYSGITAVPLLLLIGPLVAFFGTALAPFFVGSLADTHGFSSAFGLLSAAFAVGALTWIWLPETRGRRLT